MSEHEDVGAVMLEYIRQYVGGDVVDMLQNFNDAGPQGVTLTNSLETLPRLYGKYSEMTPYIIQQIRAVKSGQRSTSSIGGKMQTALLVKKVMQYQQGVYSETEQKKGGTFDFFGGNKDKNKQGTQSGLLG